MTSGPVVAHIPHVVPAMTQPGCGWVMASGTSINTALISSFFTMKLNLT